jgi:CBS-domain-containing membrane protein
MSPRAACRLETLGFREVYDYVAGKQDWLARGLPIEGERSGASLTAGDVVEADVVTCHREDEIGRVRERVERSAYPFALVVSRTGVLLGRLRRAALAGPSRATAEQSMEPGPSTIRPAVDLGGLVEQLRKQELRYAIVTTPDGKLIGVVRRPVAEARLGSSSTSA